MIANIGDDVIPIMIIIQQQLAIVIIINIDNTFGRDKAAVC